jgi:hypothetical protein
MISIWEMCQMLIDKRAAGQAVRRRIQGCRCRVIHGYTHEIQTLAQTRNRAMHALHSTQKAMNFCVATPIARTEDKEGVQIRPVQVIVSLPHPASHHTTTNTGIPAQFVVESTQTAYIP